MKVGNGIKGLVRDEETKLGEVDSARSCQSFGNGYIVQIVANTIIMFLGLQMHMST